MKALYAAHIRCDGKGCGPSEIALSLARNERELDQLGDEVIPLVFQCARDDDFTAKELVRILTESVAVVANNACAMCGVTRVALGGGLLRAQDLILARVQSLVERYAMAKPAPQVDVCLAELGDNVGAIGAAFWAHRTHTRKMEAT